MPLPADNTPWLPSPWDEAQTQYDINGAWYLGDTKKLARLYGNDRGEATHRHRGEARQGGVVGAMSRFFWGRPIPTGQNRTRLHIPVPADLAGLSADLLFAEPPEVRVAGLGDDPNKEKAKNAQDRLDLIANSPMAHATLNTMGELKAAYGAAALVTKWNRDVCDHAWLQTVAADVIVPEFIDGILSALTLFSEFQDGQTVYRHLERHESGRILHGLYKGSSSNLGRVVPLEDRPETEHLAKLVDKDSAIPTGTRFLTASYTINMPAREWRRKGVLANAGRSDFQGILPLFDAVDEAWSSWIRDLRLARARLVVPESWLNYDGAGSAASFDVDREIFAGVSSLVKPTESGMDVIQPEIRYEAHEKTVHALYREILQAAGYSPSSWGDQQSGRDLTATEVDDRNKASERTRDKKALYDRIAIGQQARAALAVDAKVFPGKGGLEMPEAAGVAFPPVSQVDPLRRAQTLAHLRTARLLTIDTGVREAHPDWDEPRVKAEVEGLLAEESRRNPLVVDPTVNPADQ